MFNKRINYKEQVGGELLGSGGYGCVFRPNIKCDTGKYSSSDDKYVSKVVANKDLPAEYNNVDTFKLKKIDPNQRLIVYPTEDCGQPNNISRADYQQCKDSTDENIDTEDGEYHNLIQKYYGETLHTIRRRKKVNYIEDSITLYMDLFKAILLLNVNNLCHRDLKESNIVIDDKGKLRIIDLSLLQSTKEPFLHSSENQFSQPESYKYWDVCFNALTTYEYGYYNRIELAVDAKDSNKDKLIILIDYADKFCEKFKDIAHIDQSLVTGLFQSCVKFLSDIFIHKNVVNKYSEAKLDNIIQSKWDVFMVGVILLQDLSFHKKKTGSDDKDDFITAFKSIIEGMICIDIYDRLTIKDVVESFSKLLDQYQATLDISKRSLKKFADDIDYISEYKTIPDYDE
jgi:serine/threonine protein kinase